MNEERKMVVAEWHAHQGRHKCFYESEQNDGMELCPSEYTVEDWLEINGYGEDEPVEEEVINFDPVNRGVDRQEGRPLSIAELRRRHELPIVEGINYHTEDEAVEADAQNAPVKNEDTAWQVEAMDYFKERLDRQDVALRAVADVLRELIESGKEQTNALSALVGAVEILATRETEPVERNIITDFLDYLQNRR